MEMILLKFQRIYCRDNSFQLIYTSPKPLKNIIDFSIYKDIENWCKGGGMKRVDTQIKSNVNAIIFKIEVSMNALTPENLQYILNTELKIRNNQRTLFPNLK